MECGQFHIAPCNPDWRASTHRRLLHPVAVYVVAAHGYHRIFCDPCNFICDNHSMCCTHTIAGKDEHIGSTNAAAERTFKYLCSEWPPLFFSAGPRL